MNESMEVWASASGIFETFLKGAGVGFGFGILFSRTINRRIGQADHDASNPSQDSRRIGSAHPARILSQGDVQAMVQPAYTTDAIEQAAKTK